MGWLVSLVYDIAPPLRTTANKADYIEFDCDGLSSTFDGVGFNPNF